MMVQKGDVLDGLHIMGQRTYRTQKGYGTIFPAVSVPVLSEHKTDMHPSVSTVAKFFTNTCRLAIRRAITVRERATQMGRPYA